MEIKLQMGVRETSIRMDNVRENERNLSQGVNPCEKVKKHLGFLKGKEFPKYQIKNQDLKKHFFFRCWLYINTNLHCRELLYKTGVHNSLTDWTILCCLQTYLQIMCKV